MGTSSGFHPLSHNDIINLAYADHRRIEYILQTQRSVDTRKSLSWLTSLTDLYRYRSPWSSHSYTRHTHWHRHLGTPAYTKCDRLTKEESMTLCHWVYKRTTIIYTCYVYRSTSVITHAISCTIILFSPHPFSGSSITLYADCLTNTIEGLVCIPFSIKCYDPPLHMYVPGWFSQYVPPLHIEGSSHSSSSEWCHPLVTW